MPVTRTVHTSLLLASSSSNLKVPETTATCGAALFGPVLEVGHVDVDDAVEEREAVERVVGARVVHDRKPQPERHRFVHRFDYLRDDVLRRDEVDVVAALFLQPQHHRRDLARTVPALDVRPDVLADVVVLAENAPQIAVAEEDRPRAVPISQTVLFAEMREEAGDQCVAARLARRPALLEAVHAAVARADAAIGERRHRLPGALLKTLCSKTEVCGFVWRPHVGPKFGWHHACTKTCAGR